MSCSWPACLPAGWAGRSFFFLPRAPALPYAARSRRRVIPTLAPRCAAAAAAAPHSAPPRGCLGPSPLQQQRLASLDVLFRAAPGRCPARPAKAAARQPSPAQPSPAQPSTQPSPPPPRSAQRAPPHRQQNPSRRPPLELESAAPSACAWPAPVTRPFGRAQAQAPGPRPGLSPGPRPAGIQNLTPPRRQPHRAAASRCAEPGSSVRSSRSRRPPYLLPRFSLVRHVARTTTPPAAPRSVHLSSRRSIAPWPGLTGTSPVPLPLAAVCPDAPRSRAQGPPARP